MAKKTNATINGKDYYRIRRKVGEDADGKAIIKNFYGEGKQDAELKYAEYIKALENSPSGSKNDSLGKIAKFYTYEVLLNEKLAAGTIERYESQYRAKLAPSKLATRPIKDITSGAVQKYLNELACGTLDGKEIDVTQGSLRALVKFLRRLFKYMELEGYCRNLMVNIPVPILSLPDERKKALSKKPDDDSDIQIFDELEVKKIISTPNRISFLFQLALATGLREGELMALRYDDFVDGTVRVNKQLNFAYIIKSDGTREYKGTIKAPKSPSSVRTVPVPANVQAALKKHAARHKAEMLENGYRTDYVFTSQSGQPIEYGNFRRAWIRHLKRAGVEYKKFHACRATYCTLLCKRGINLEVASKLMGHSDINITAAFYRFVSANEMSSAVKKLDDLFFIEN